MQGSYSTSIMPQLRVRDLMTTQVVTLKATSTVRQATIKFAVNNISGAPVVDGKNHLIGILSENDILNLIVKYQDQLGMENPALYMLACPMDEEIEDERVRKISKEISEMTIDEIMTTDVTTTTPDTTVMEVLKMMVEKGLNRVPVLERGVLVGIVSRGDIIFSIYRRKV
jgi:CBS domain-containing protein